MDTKEIDITDGIRQFYIPKLNTISKSADVSLRRWLALKDSFIPSYIGPEDSFELIFYDITVLLSCIASDISRLSCASIETLNSINESMESRKFLAWDLVKYYYSAFFSAHSTLKICGFGLIHLDHEIVCNIQRRASTLGVTFPPISQGVYCFRIDVIASKVTFFKVSKYDDSHKGLWHRYIDFLNVLSGVSIETENLDTNCIRRNESGKRPQKCVYSQMPLTDAETIVTRFDELKKAIDRRGNSNWLSTIRNTINYNHEYGVWFPYKRFEVSYYQLLSFKDLYFLSPLDEKFSIDSTTDLLDFVKCCLLVNSINYSILIDLEKRHPEKKSFLLYGPSSYIKLYKRH